MSKEEIKHKIAFDIDETLINMQSTVIDELTVSKPIKFINLRYTRFIEFRSDTLTQFSKNRNVAGTRGTNNLILRIFPATKNIGLVRISAGTPVNFNFDPSFALQSFDISLFDEFGDPLFVPEFTPGTTSGFWWSFIFITET